ncbi:MAG: right-handed parallel beta-helix repeat-containing protein, partial [Planctomycetota bacterium]
HAQVYTVTNTNNAGTGSLRAAINAMNSAGISPSAIVFQTTGTIQLSSPQLPAIQVSVQINFAGSPIVIDGSSAGASAAGLRFFQNTADSSFVNGITFRNFETAGIIINPSNSTEPVGVFNCSIEDCGGDGIRIADGVDHLSASTDLLGDASNSTWGTRFNTTGASNSTLTLCGVSGNAEGGVQIVGNGHTVDNCVLSVNGSSEVSDHRGGVVFGSTSSSASACNALNSTIAGNTPYGVKRTSGSTACEIRGNEMYLNDQAGIRILGAQPTASISRFIIDTVNGQVIIGGSATGPANTPLELEFFADVFGLDEGSAHFDADDLTVQLNGSGNVGYFHKLDDSVVFLAEALSTPGPYNLTVTNSSLLTATATSATQGTSEFGTSGTVALAGDFNLDGAVSGTDLLILQRNFGSQNAEYWEGDADFDGDVDGDDQDIWQANFGQTP